MTEGTRERFERLAKQLGITSAPWQLTTFTKPDGSEIKTPADVAETTAHSSMMCEGTVLWGITSATEPLDPEGRAKIICYTGNGPTSEKNARAIAMLPEILAQLEAATEGEAELREALRGLLDSHKARFAGEDGALMPSWAEPQATEIRKATIRAEAALK